MLGNRDIDCQAREVAGELRDTQRIKKLTDRLDIHEAAIVEVLREVMRILNPLSEPEAITAQNWFSPVLNCPRAWAFRIIAATPEVGTFYFCLSFFFRCSPK